MLIVYNVTFKFGKDSRLIGQSFKGGSTERPSESGIKFDTIKQKIVFDVTNANIKFPLILANKSDFLDIGNVDFEFTKEPEFCVDLFSFGKFNNALKIASNMINMGIINNQIVQLSHSKLLRYCPVGKEDNEVVCKMFKNRYYEDNLNGDNYDYKHCPCNNDETTDCYFVPFSNSLNTPKDIEHEVNMTFTDLIETVQVGTEFPKQTLNGWFNTFNFFNKFVFTRNMASTPSDVLIEMGIKKSIKQPLVTVEVLPKSFSYVTANIETNEAIVMKQFTSTKQFNFTTNVPYVLLVTNNKINFTDHGIYTTFNFDSVSLDFTHLHSVKVITKDPISDGKFHCSETMFEDNKIKCKGTLELTCNATEFADYVNQACHTQPVGSKKCFSITDCIACNDNYIMDEDNHKCIQKEDSCLFSSSDECRRCKFGFTLINAKCESCADHCGICDDSPCDFCYNSVLNNEGKLCDMINGSEYYKDGQLIQCDNSHFMVSNNMCSLCETSNENCEFCDNNKLCSKCKIGFVFNSKNECVSKKCSDMLCEQCEDGYVFSDNGTCVAFPNKCKTIRKGICIDCEEGTTLVGGECVDNAIVNCMKYTTSNGCLQCENGYFWDSGKCTECSDECKTCLNKANNCLTCPEGTFISEGTCSTNEKLEGICLQYASNGGCVRCKEGYFRKEFDCVKCDDECETCQSKGSCVLCNSEHFMTFENTCKLKSLIEGCQTDISSVSGCLQCSIGYYLYHKECYRCDDKCLTCENAFECLSCNSTVVLSNSKCFVISEIKNCISILNSQCTKCTFWKAPNDNGDGCNTKIVWWVLLLVVLFVVMILILLIVVTALFTNKMLKKIHQNQQEQNVCVFKINRSNISFPFEVCESLVSNKSKLTFKDDSDAIPVGEETRELICFGNTGDSTMKVQITVKEGCVKYQIRSRPNIITLKKGEACEFEIFIRPLCTSNTEDSINLVTLDMKKGKPITSEFRMCVETVISTKLDFDELVEETKIGEGSFGIVYKGTFRGNVVAIKKMKQCAQEEENGEIEEFEKEVEMLDKFRSQYIVHFYGAVFIPNKICMVTEFAQYGSLHDLIKNKDRQPIPMKLRIKMVTDAARGILYLHENGILHRDIKPDNILVVSLDETVAIHGKLTDFGSSRNINMMMTNMTFTKGIGSPSYMAPEVLHQDKYKKPADIFSFAITLYECVKWGEAYPKTEFKFPWKIAEFVNKGNRLNKADGMPESIYKIIKLCWAQDSNLRLDIMEVVSQLSTLIL
ncbi:protein serine/threonine kinase, putative [Entamoeba invadens IP1]|uniref:Protein serine/threonine kinase, putative n=1 Tax=Entamoeba invadens IP1 TaxID=370355 RepID=A0A0A1U4T4_ENTIV|nr:protein serine/threonine kinase, putative [Entamoeba invadens IP1]ELP87898.1 protein serine/threonine kinase, putative [Entamoeba invadens IP1]|eukprot:XP_004254669.1 protein serine/threonine kinase, putative [Entamoeba invadens IP1]